MRPLPDDVVRLLPMFLLIRRLVQIGWINARPELSEWSEIPARRAKLVARVEGFEPPC